MNDGMHKKRTISLIRWIARIVGLLYIAFFLLMLIGEGMSPAKLTFHEGLGFVFIFIYFVGLILAWKWEGVGGWIAIGGTIGWAVAIEEYSLLTVIMAAPAILFLICWLLSGRRLTISKAP